MKKVILALISLLVVLVIGFLCGARFVLFKCHKWVEEDHGMYLIVTEFMGNEYIDVADKPGNSYTYFSYAIERRQ